MWLKISLYIEVGHRYNLTNSYFRWDLYGVKAIKLIESFVIQYEVRVYDNAACS